jgi:hypothetical protein
MARVYSVDPILFHRFSGVDVENVGCCRGEIDRQARKDNLYPSLTPRWSSTSTGLALPSVLGHYKDFESGIWPAFIIVFPSRFLVLS